MAKKEKKKRPQNKQQQQNPDVEQFLLNANWKIAEGLL